MNNRLRTRYSTAILLLFFFLYLYLVLSLVFFDRLGTTASWNGLNLTPLRSILDYLETTSVSKAVVIENLVGNALLFLPLGIFLREFNWCKHWPYQFLLLFSFSLGIETAQYLCHIGSFDVDDILLNTLGGLIGLGLQSRFRAFVPINQQARFYTMLASVLIGLPSAYYIFFIYTL